jgi:hypothetical protein
MARQSGSTDIDEMVDLCFVAAKGTHGRIAVWLDHATKDEAADFERIVSRTILRRDQGVGPSISMLVEKMSAHFRVEGVFTPSTFQKWLKNHAEP